MLASFIYASLTLFFPQGSLSGSGERKISKPGCKNAYSIPLFSELQKAKDRDRKAAVAKKPLPR